jgi:hypothetical protein
MFDTVQFVAQTLAAPDALTTFALRFLCVLILGVSLAILLIGAGFVLAQCCRGDRPGAISAALLLCLPPMLAGIAAAEVRSSAHLQDEPTVCQAASRKEMASARVGSGPAPSKSAPMPISRCDSALSARYWRSEMERT